MYVSIYLYIILEGYIPNCLLRVLISQGGLIEIVGDIYVPPYVLLYYLTLLMSITFKTKNDIKNPCSLANDQIHFKQNSDLGHWTMQLRNDVL